MDRASRITNPTFIAHKTHVMGIKEFQTSPGKEVRVGDLSLRESSVLRPTLESYDELVTHDDNILLAYHEI